MDSRIHGLQDSRIPGFPDSRITRITGLQGFLDSRIPGFQDYKDSWIQGRRWRSANDHSSAMVYTFSWTTAEGKREHVPFRPGKLAKAGFVDPWGRLGNQRSHLSIAESALRKGLSTVMVLEDDAFLVEGWTGCQAMSCICSAIADLNKKRPSWELLMLGGQTIGGFRAPATNNGRCGLGADILAAECMYQSHAYVL